jgi:1,4-dihydroxy-2-naphthoate octaprenyltransferase
VGDVLRIVEARTKIIGASSVLVGTAYAAWTTRRLDAATLALMLSATLAIDLATAGFNSYFDFVRGVDTVETDVDRYKVLVHRDVDPRVALWISVAAFAAAGLLGLALGARVGWEVVGVGVVCMAVAFFYSGGPKPIAATPVGEVFAGGFLGLVLVTLSYYVQAGHTPRDLLLVGLPSTALIADILAVNNACDTVGDARAGRRTLAIVVGPRGAEVVVVALVAAGYAGAVGLAIAGVLPRASLPGFAAAAALSGRQLVAMRRRGYTHATKGASMGGISSIFLLYTAAFVVGLALDAATRGAR